jgi:hypothetical protein
MTKYREIKYGTMALWYQGIESIKFIILKRFFEKTYFIRIQM